MHIRKTVVLALFFCLTSFLPGQTEKKEPEIAAGIGFPSVGTVYGLDTVDGKPGLLQVHATEVTLNSRAAGNLARSFVYMGPRGSAELKGISSAATFHTQRAVFYVRLNSDDPELLRNRVKLISLKAEKDRRVVSDFSMNIFGGQRKRELDEIPVEKSDVAKTQWLKLTPKAPLKPGEYGIVFMPKDVNQFADAVYDFSILGKDTKPQVANK